MLHLPDRLCELLDALDWSPLVRLPCPTRFFTGKTLSVIAAIAATTRF